MAAPPWRKGIITRIENETPNTRRFWIQIPEVASFDFEPGQFVTIDLPIHEKPNKRWRSYSIASWPDGTNVIELLIVLLEGGKGTSYLFQEGKVGLELILRGPQGVFTLPKPIDKDLYFICTGTGIAPFRSMIHYIQEHKIPHKDIYLIFGTRKRDDLLYMDEMKRLEMEIEGFHYIPTLSRDQWEGCCGYVHAVYENLVNEKRTDHSVKEAGFYLCGWKNMVDEAKLRIQNLGYDKKSIHLELYG
ncbi:ferredoxin--NADP reductase [Flavisolibacter ginsengisoli]|jgi:CDP-4-dehydro-6-deoxyglucose reductase|uniref:CDP-4-dehydro-6-deoxyglucose reductase n=1 Tax=Flavisolibacter ginsengisoli DSM 18119 TaxID=1121884 RepID=A0A1M4W0A0_9BACT|nr:FAD-binding oxidoreductase [Flavisolibacter ginsengisoli]SHE74560.1 CDP-4-dehydro-6-deoxyglucose reductase [Flavisolibacter ginsengisoli DSM 18119]